MANESRAQFDHISIGSMDPFGLPSFFSAESIHLTVAAPADSYALSKGNEDNFSKFGGTSSSAPLVTGFVANLLSILPDISSEEVKELLMKTSIPTRIQQDSKIQRNGVGMITAYKLAKVAIRLQQLGFPINRKELLQSRFKQAISSGFVSLTVVLTVFRKSASCSRSRKKSFFEIEDWLVTIISVLERISLFWIAFTLQLE